MKHDIYSVVAGILPALLGLGLIEAYITRDVSVTVVGFGILALALLTVVMAAISDTVESAASAPSRHRSRA